VLTNLQTLLLFDFKAVTQLSPLSVLGKLRALTVSGFDGLNNPVGWDLSILGTCSQLRVHFPHCNKHTPAQYLASGLECCATESNACVLAGAHTQVLG